MAKRRPSFDELYLGIARSLAERGTCLRRNFGAVITSEDNILLSTGYCGAPRGTPNCSDIGKCYRQEKNVPSGQNYELCRSVHAEANAVINAARQGTKILGGKIYLCGIDAQTGELSGIAPCMMCKRVIINAGLTEVIIQRKDGIEKINVADWVEEANRDPFNEINL